MLYTIFFLPIVNEDEHGMGHAPPPLQNIYLKLNDLESVEKLRQANMILIFLLILSFRYVCCVPTTENSLSDCSENFPASDWLFGFSL